MDISYEGDQQDSGTISSITRNPDDSFTLVHPSICASSSAEINTKTSPNLLISVSKPMTITSRALCEFDFTEGHARPENIEDAAVIVKLNYSLQYYDEGSPIQLEYLNVGTVAAIANFDGEGVGMRGKYARVTVLLENNTTTSFDSDRINGLHIRRPFKHYFAKATDYTYQDGGQLCSLNTSSAQGRAMQSVKELQQVIQAKTPEAMKVFLEPAARKPSSSGSSSLPPFSLGWSGFGSGENGSSSGGSGSGSDKDGSSPSESPSIDVGEGGSDSSNSPPIQQGAFAICNQSVPVGDPCGVEPLSVPVGGLCGDLPDACNSSSLDADPSIPLSPDTEPAPPEPSNYTPIQQSASAKKKKVRTALILYPSRSSFRSTSFEICSPLIWLIAMSVQ
jgi:hypothetical protein